MYKWEEDLIKELKKSIFELLLIAGETPISNDIEKKEKYIMSGGIKFSKISNNSREIYEIEDTFTNDGSYHIINNITILKLLKEYIKKLVINIKNKNKLLTENEVNSILTYNNLEKELNFYENHNRKP